jgi:hypothetical protein
VLYELGLAVFDAILRVEAPGVGTLSIMAAVDSAGSPSQILDAGRRVRPQDAPYDEAAFSISRSVAHQQKSYAY